MSQKLCWKVNPDCSLFFQAKSFKKGASFQCQYLCILQLTRRCPGSKKYFLETCFLVFTAKDHLFLSVVNSVTTICRRNIMLQSSFQRPKNNVLLIFVSLRTYVLCDIRWLGGQSLFAWQEGKKQCCHPSLDLQYGQCSCEGGRGALCKGGRGWALDHRRRRSSRSVGRHPMPLL